MMHTNCHDVVNRVINDIGNHNTNRITDNMWKKTQLVNTKYNKEHMDTGIKCITKTTIYLFHVFGYSLIGVNSTYFSYIFMFPDFGGHGFN